MKTQPLPKLKSKLEEIEILTYRLRFINSNQFQKLLKHKHRQKIIKWLNKLTEGKYLKRYYDGNKFPPDPASYSLGTAGRKYFKKHLEIKDINIPLLDRVWWEHNSTDEFKNHWAKLVDIYISLLSLVKKIDKGRGQLRFFTNTDLTGVKHLIYPEPDAFFIIKPRKGHPQSYLLDIFDMPVYKSILRERVEKYLDYFYKKLWQNNMKQTFPEIMFVCPNNWSKNFLNKYIKENNFAKISFYLSTWDEIKKQGLNRQVLHKVELQ